ncbi:hypothetical protein C1645_811024 [Glomus cerebriforme]|uniref:Uncharacterized protein n=1 Tax=Glomus cerebriforme TaxID=658196 RepID=A0A397TQH8_9GLOM|nr:hypothetical protein C1645_811024 [Glomus cerebriforme]
MITIAILNDKQNIYKPDHHYTTVLYSDIENYEVLEIMMASFIQELDDLKNNGLTIMESDGILNYILVQIRSNNKINWKINKKIEKVNEYAGHNKKPLFYIISLDKWIPDELHIRLRIWDHLWSLVLAELKEYNQFDNICHDEIVQEINRIGIHFQFWEERETNIWSHTSLMDRVIPNLTCIERGLYKSSTITPYMHVLTFKDENDKHKSAIIEILEYENRTLFYLFGEIDPSILKPKKLIFFEKLR